MKNTSRHFLQSKQWAAFQTALKKEVVSRSGEGWSYMAVVEKAGGVAGKLHHRLYAPYGPTAADSKTLSRAIADMQAEARRLNVTYIRLEPVISSGELDMRQFNAHRKARDYQPAMTHIIDLTKSEAELLHDMSGTNRNLWNTYTQKGISFRKSYDPADIKPFLGMIHEVAKRNGIIQHTDDYFKTLFSTLVPDKAAGLVFGELKDKPIVAALFYDDLEAGVRYYAYAGSHDEARKLQANSPLVSFLLFDAKASGLRAFDLYGVSPVDEPQHAWAGHSKFKRSFGGYDHGYAGTWEIAVSKSLYRLAVLTRKLRV